MWVHTSLVDHSKVNHAMRNTVAQVLGLLGYGLLRGSGHGMQDLSLEKAAEQRKGWKRSI